MIFAGVLALPMVEGIVIGWCFGDFETGNSRRHILDMIQL